MSVGFERLAAALNQAGVRYVVIGVSGANYWARSGHTLFTTKDFDLFMPPEPDNTMRVWRAAEATGLALYVGEELLDRPRDLFLAERIVERRALVRATDARGLDVDFLVLVTAGALGAGFPARRAAQRSSPTPVA